MENKLSKEERIKEKEKLSNVITQKMGIVFAAIIVAVMLLIRVGDFFVPVYVDGGIHNFTQVIAVQLAMGVLAVAAIIWYVLSLKGKKDYRYSVFSPAFALGLALSALFGALVYPVVGASATILSLIALSVLFFVYEIYPVDFFISSVAVISGCLAATVATAQNATAFKKAVVLIVYAFVMAVCVCAFAKLFKNGKLKIGTRTVKKPHGMLTAAVCICLAVSLVCFIGALLLSGYFLYCMAAACIVYFIIAIIYTVKLM